MSLKLIASSIEILTEIQPATVRAVKALLSDMGKSCTSGVSKQLVYARETGSIPWAWIVDETREPERPPSWDDPEQFALVVQRSYRRDRWAQQPRRLEVWSEKGTVRGTLAPVLDKYGVTFRVMHGYSSATVLNQVVDETRDSVCWCSTSATGILPACTCRRWIYRSGLLSMAVPSKSSAWR